jgi:acyl carrier protein
MSDLPDIESKLLEFLREEVFSPTTVLAENTDLIAAGFDSLSLVSLLLFVEKTYALWIPENELNESTLKNIHTIAALIARLLNERKTAS